jgi:hypothetical protein
MQEEVYIYIFVEDCNLCLEDSINQIIYINLCNVLKNYKIEFDWKYTSIHLISYIQPDLAIYPQHLSDLQENGNIISFPERYEYNGFYV